MDTDQVAEIDLTPDTAAAIPTPFTSRQYAEQRGPILAKMNAIHETITAEKRSWTGEEQAEWNAMDADAEALHDASMRSATLERSTASLVDQHLPVPLQRSAAPTVEDEPMLDFGRCLESWLRCGASEGTPEDYARLERSPFDPHKKKVPLDFSGLYRTPELRSDGTPQLRNVVIGTDAAGGIVSAGEDLQPLELAMAGPLNAVRNAAELIRTSNGVDFPFPHSDDSDNKAAIYGEGADTTATNPTFASTKLRSFMYRALVKVSIEWLRDSAINSTAFMMGMMGERFARGFNEHATTGDGASQPQGIVTSATDSSVTNATFGTYLFSEIFDLEATVEQEYADSPSAAFMGHRTTLFRFKKIKDGQSRPIWQQSLVAGEPDLFDGYPFHTNPDMPHATATKALLFGDMSRYKVREVSGGMEMRQLSELYIQNGLIGFIAFGAFDGRLVDAGKNPIKYLLNG